MSEHANAGKRSEGQFDVPEGHDWSWNAETQDEMSQYFANQDKIAKETESKQPANPPF